MEWLEVVLKWSVDNHEVYKTVAMIAGGVCGLLIAAKRCDAMTSHAETNELNHLTDTYTRAIEQLGKDNEVMQIGALGALGKLAFNNQDYFKAVMEVICAYIRLRPSSKNDFVTQIPTQVALDVIRTRNKGFNKIMISPLNLREASLISAALSGANLICANLSAANLSGANLICADLRGADLSYADLRYADLSGAALSYANLNCAELSSANLKNADIRNTNIFDANIKEALNLTPGQIESAKKESF